MSEIQLGVVLIGVSTVKSPRLQRLQAVEPAVARMRSWAASQTTPDLILEFTDADGPVTIGAVTQGVRDLMDRGLDRLVIYFSGHGVAVGPAEYWMLSEAPELGHEAVNLEWSRISAQRSSIPYVVFISDACRIHADTVQIGSMNGASIIPNRDAVGGSKYVDLLYATRLGDGAHEVRNPDAASYRAVYTEVIADLLTGVPSTVIDWAGENDEGHISTWRMAPIVAELMRQRLDELQDLSLSQDPDQILSSDASLWVSRVPRVPLATPEPVPVAAEPPANETTVATGEIPVVEPGTDTRETPVVAPPELATDAEIEHLTAPPSAPPRPRTGGRLRPWKRWRFGSSKPAYRDSHLLSPWWINAIVSFHDAEGDRVEVDTTPWMSPQAAFSNTPPELVDCGDAGHLHYAFDLHKSPKGCGLLVTLPSGRTTVLPMPQNYAIDVTTDGTTITGVTFEELDQVVFDKPTTPFIRDMRAFVASASASGTFRPTREGLRVFDANVVFERSVDPTLSLYAAYTAVTLGEHERLATYSTGTDPRFFDLDLLSGSARPENFGFMLLDCPPPFPVMTQGWAMLPAFGVTSHLIEQLQPHLTASLWTVFQPEAAPILRAASA